MILSFDDQEDVLAFVGGADSPELSQVGAACPDHLVHTKVVPLFIDWTPDAEDIEGLKAKLVEGVAAYKEQYQQYFESNKNEGDVMFEAAPRVILIPGVGMINTGKSWALSQEAERCITERLPLCVGLLAWANSYHLVQTSLTMWSTGRWNCTNCLWLQQKPNSPVKWRLLQAAQAGSEVKQHADWYLKAHMWCLLISTWRAHRR